ncbi:MAG TPA: hypothetical protein VGN20_23935 [Mucilaginibacter sp.]|jgi:hypothetical protein
MKKLVIPLLFTFLIVVTGFSQTTYKSLNGFSQLDAKNMISPFQALNSQAPQKTSVWFDKKIINNMIKLLKSEVAQKKTDGIRIYFAYDNSHNETVIVVSTYNSGVPNSKSEEKDTYHEDYYDHLSMAALFNMKYSNGTAFPISGLPCHDDCGGGAVLYGPSPGGDDASCDSASPHYLTKLQCETMVQYFVQNTTNINSTGEWFDIDMIKAFAKESSKIKHYDGIRFYFARHPDTPARYKYLRDKDAFVVVTTQSTVDPKVHKDYFNCKEALAIYNDLKYFKMQKNEKASFAITSNGQDNGELCPSNCDN